MKRNELTLGIMKDRGWVEADKGPSIEEVVRLIKDGTYTHLRCTKDTKNRYWTDEHTMCSSYDVIYGFEYLEASYDNIHWFSIAKRRFLISRTCVYAD